MITQSKLNGALSTAGDGVKKGSRGRLELSAEATGDTFRVLFQDFGNYGRVRWEGQLTGLDRSSISNIINSLQALLDGRVATTRVPFEDDVTPQEEANEVLAAAV